MYSVLLTDDITEGFLFYFYCNWIVNWVSVFNIEFQSNFIEKRDELIPLQFFDEIERHKVN